MDLVYLAVAASGVATQFLDWHSTMRTIRGGGYETNPLVDALDGDDGERLWLVKGGYAVLFAASYVWLATQDMNPGTYWGLAALGTLFNAGTLIVALNNYRVITWLDAVANWIMKLRS